MLINKIDYEIPNARLQMFTHDDVIISERCRHQTLASFTTFSCSDFEGNLIGLAYGGNGSIISLI